MFKFEMEEKSEVSSYGIWAEKYKPTSLAEFIGDDNFKQTIQLFIDKQEIQNLFLFGPPGTGKSTIAKLLINTIPCDYLWLNSSDESGIDDLRNKVQDFAMTMGMHPLKIVVLDEFDRTLASSQGILRGIIDQYQSSTRFILTCNYQERVIDAVKSRCQSFEVKPLSKSLIMAHIVNILNKEKITYEMKDVAFIINSYSYDLRKIINFAQQSSINGVLKIVKANTADQDYQSKLVELLKTPNKAGVFDELRQTIANASFSNYEVVYKYLFDKVDEYAKTKAAEAILILAEYSYQSAIVFEREITMVACIHKLLTVLNSK